MYTYQRRTRFDMRPYVLGEDLTDVVVGHGDVVEEGGMIGDNKGTKYYVSKSDFIKYYELGD